MCLLSSVDDELEEIKKLLEGDITGSSLDFDEPGSVSAKPGGADAPAEQRAQQAEFEFFSAPIISEKTAPKSGLPALRRGHGVPQTRQAPGTPAIRNAPMPPQTRQEPEPPAIRNAPMPPQTRQEPEAPAVSRRRRPPSQPVMLEPPDMDDDGTDKFRSYDITDNGRIKKSSDNEQDLDTGSAKFKINFDFESAYKDVPEEKPLRLRRERRTGCVGGILYGAFVISVSLLFATLLWMAAADVLGFGRDDEEVNITIPANFVIEDVTDMLYDAGLIKYKYIFNMYAGFSHAEDKITSGTYVLNTNFDYRAIVQGMTARARVRTETSVTIPEGFTLAQIFTLLEDYGVCPANELWEAATNHDFKYSFLDKETLGDRLRLEGYLFPETHNFYLESEPVQVINTLLREFNRRFTEDYVIRAEDMGYSLREIIIIASMIEREAGDDEERPRIAAVIYNRLNSKDFPNLQIDATIHYAIAGTGRQFSTDIEHPYNTYICEGLPPGPIANPGMPSIRAALYPDSTNEYYYALNKEGTHNFFRTRTQHENFVKSDNYGGG